MKDAQPSTLLVEDSNSTGFNFNAYTPGCATVNQQKITHSFILIPQSGILPWAITSINELKNESWDQFITFKLSILLLGVGDKLIFPEPSCLAPLFNQRIGVEIMTNDAVCRTYNVLATENRHCAAALIFTNL